MRMLSLTLPIVLIASITTSAQTAEQKRASSPQIVEQVSVRGNRRIPEADVLSWIRTRKGRIYSPRKVDRDVRTLFNTGHFTSVRAFVEVDADGGQLVTFEVRERLLIQAIDFDGLDPFEQAAIEEEWSRQGVSLSKGTEYDAFRVWEAAKIIQQFLNIRGTDDQRVIPWVEQLTQTELSLRFRIVKAGVNR